MWPWVLTLSDVEDPWAGIPGGESFSFFVSEHGGKQVMFGIGRVIMMLDLRMNSYFGDKVVRTTEVVLAVDMLLRISQLAISNMHRISVSLRKRTLGIVICGNAGVDTSVMATVFKFHPFIDLQLIVFWDLFRLHGLAPQAGARLSFQASQFDRLSLCSK